MGRLEDSHAPDREHGATDSTDRSLRRRLGGPTDPDVDDAVSDRDREE